MLLTSTKFWIDHRTSVCALCANNTRIGTVLLLARRFTVLAMLCTVFVLLAVDEVQCWRELPALDWAIHCTQIFTALRSAVHCFQRPSLVQVCQGGAAFVPWNIQQTSTLTRNLIFQALPLIGSPPNTFYQTRVRSRHSIGGKKMRKKWEKKWENKWTRSRNEPRGEIEGAQLGKDPAARFTEFYWVLLAYTGFHLVLT